MLIIPTVITLPTTYADLRTLISRAKRDPFETVWAFVQERLTEELTAAAKELFERLQARMPGLFTDGQLRTLQRRVKQWRTEIARRLVLGAARDSYPGIPVVADSGQEELLK